MWNSHGRSIQLYRLACQHGAPRPHVRVPLRLGLVLPLRPLRLQGIDALPLRFRVLALCVILYVGLMNELVWGNAKVTTSDFSLEVKTKYIVLMILTRKRET